MIPKSKWPEIVKRTIWEMMYRGHPIVAGWNPSGYEMIDRDPEPSMMRMTQVVFCPRCHGCNIERPMELRPWVYFPGRPFLGINDKVNTIHFIRWDREPYGFVFGICPVCRVVSFIFYPSGQATFFYMTQIGRESCIET